MRLRIPEQAVFGGELRGQLGLEPIELATELPELIGSRPELTPRFLDLAADLLQLGPGLLPRPLDLGLRRRDQPLRIGFRPQR